MQAATQVGSGNELRFGTAEQPPAGEILRASLFSRCDVVDETSKLPTIGPSTDLRKALLRIADECRLIGGGRQAEQLDQIAERLKTPKLTGIVSELAHPLVWPTREYALWMAERLTVAAEIMRALRDDAEITGSIKTIEAMREWFESMEFKLETPPVPIAVEEAATVTPIDDLEPKG